MTDHQSVGHDPCDLVAWIYWSDEWSNGKTPNFWWRYLEIDPRHELTAP